MLTFTDAELSEARALNRRLAKLPRVKPGARLKFALLQGMLRVTQALLPVRLDGIKVSKATAALPGRRPVQLRVLTPKKKPRGLYIDIHGGGWVMGNARMDDALNRDTIHDCGFLILSVEYGLALHQPLETLIDDCETAMRWILQNPDYSNLPVFLRGESAGGHLAVATLLRLRDQGLAYRIKGVLLYYGVYDMGGTPSVRRAGPETLVLHGPTLPQGLAMLLPDRTEAQRRAPDVSPLHGDLKGLPPALLTGGALDPLLDDTCFLADRWQAASGSTALEIVPDAPHGFIHFKTAMARKVTRHAHAWLNGLVKSE